VYKSALSLAALFLVSTAAHAAPELSLKPGLWLVLTTTTTQPGDVVVQTRSYLCRNSAYDEFAAVQLKLAAPGCTTLSDTIKNNSQTVLSACQTKLSTSFTSTSFTLLTATTAHAETETAYNPASAGILTLTQVQDQSYVSPCPAGMAPGDLTLPDGAVQHLWTH